MKRLKNRKRTIKTVCYNCKTAITLTRSTVQDTEIDGLTVAFVECPVCGEKIVKQIDTEDTLKNSKKVVELTLRGQHKRLPDKQKERLKKLERELYNTRKELKTLHTNRVYQLLNE